MRAEGTPVPIPNTTVKIRAADGTMLETAWESRRLPDIFIETKRSGLIFAERFDLCFRHKTHMLLRAMSIQEGIPAC